LKANDIQKIINLGITDAKNVVAKGHGASLEHLLHYHALKKSGDNRVETITLGDFLEAKENGVFETYDYTTDPSFIKNMLME
jgi:hypothetical protein